MKIHELNNYTGEISENAYLAVDNGTDTAKISAAELLSETNDRLDNLITNGFEIKQAVLTPTWSTFMGLNLAHAAITVPDGSICLEARYRSQPGASGKTDDVDVLVAPVNGVNQIDVSTSKETIESSAQFVVSYAVPSQVIEGGAELTDIRVGAAALGGTTYSTAGDAVRGQATALNDKIANGLGTLKGELDEFDSAIYSDVVRDVATYNFGTWLANAYVWVATETYVPKGTGGKLVCLNYVNGGGDGNNLHIILLKKNGGDTFEVVSDETIVTVPTGVNVYIPKALTRFNDIYIGFYSMDNGMVYQSSGRTTPFTRYEYNSQSVGDTVTVSGAFNLDFSFALFTTVEPVEPAYPVIVDVNGQGKYTSILDAINGEPESTVIYVYPGVYEQDMTECLRKRIILIGADRNQCIIRDTDGRYGHHALYVSCGYFENLTIEEPYVSGVSNEVSVSELGAYAVHVDTDEDYAVGKQIEFHHCNIRSDFFPAMGVGLRKDMTLILDDCLLENNQVNGRGDYSDEGTLGALYFHDSNGEQGDQYVVLKNNVFRSKLKYAMCPYQVYRNPQNNRVHCDFINNVLYSDVGKYADTVWFRGDPFNASTGIFSIGIGYGNSIASLNN